MIKTTVMLLMIISLLVTLSACSTYKSSFNCGDAQGAYCVSMDWVDQMIKSGEIERFNEQQRNKRYKAQNDKNTLMPRVKPKPVNITNYEAEDASH